MFLYIKISLRPWIILPLLAITLVFFKNETLASQTSHPRVIRSKPVFIRAFKKEVGHGGFAYQGIRKKYEIEDYLLAGIKQSPQRSPWFESEKQLYKNLLKRQSFDVLVVPFQTQLDGVDPIGRSIMSYRLAIEIERQTGLSVAPLPLVHFALGSHARYYSDAEIFSLAKSLGVSYIIWGFAGTREDDKGHIQHLDFTICYQSGENFGSSSGSRGKHWRSIRLSPNQLPSILFENHLNEVMAFINLPNNTHITNTNIILGEQPPIPERPGAFFTAEINDAIAKSYYYQFMGMLTPTDAEFHRQYMFIRSLVALTEINPDHPEYSILKARAYHHLKRRPAALQALNGNNSAEAKFLRGIINGNLPPLESTFKQLKSPMNKFLATMEYSWLMYRYTDKYPEKHIEMLLKRFPEWRYYFELIIKDLDSWDVPTNIALKQTMDAYFPVQGFTFKNIVQKADKQNSAIDVDLTINFSFQEHIKKYLLMLKEQDFSFTHLSGPNTLDHLIMMEGIGLSNLLKRLRFLFYVQSLPEKAMSLCLEYLKKYQGHPYFTLMYANILESDISTRQGVEKKQVISEAVSNAILGLWWYGRQGWAFYQANSVLKSREIQDKKLLDQIMPHKNLLYCIASDYPFLPFCARKGWMRPYEDLIDWSCCDVSDFKSIIKFSHIHPQMLDIVRNKVKGRFLGHPGRHKIEIALTRTSDPKTPYLQMLNQGTTNWTIYYELGEMYADDGEYKKAQEILMKYPGFTESSMDRVELSNRAFYGGSILFRRGAYNESRPLFQYSADLRTGSSASLTSSARIALLDYDLKTAEDYMLRCAQRYDSPYAFRDFMSIAHMMGESEIAWKQFKKLLGRYSSPQIWTSAFIGHRINRTSLQELKSWIKTMAELNQTSRQRSFSARFALMCLIDRQPDMEMAELVNTFDDLKKYDFLNRHVFKGPDGEIIGPQIFGSLYYNDISLRDSITPEGTKKSKALFKRYYEEDIPRQPFSFYGSFALAYVKIKQKEYSDAYDILKRQSLLYSYGFGLGKSVKPYLVWAAINSENQKEIKRFLNEHLSKVELIQKPKTHKKQDDNLKFDDELAIAAYACGIGENEFAVERLKKAFNKLPQTGKRTIFPMYQIVELCEWFYERSNDRSYIDLALKWSKDYQVIQPMFGWAFAFEAKYTDDDHDRKRALAYALYLDSESSRISHFSENEKNAARKWFKKNNQFKTVKSRGPILEYFYNIFQSYYKIIEKLIGYRDK